MSLLERLRRDIGAELDGLCAWMSTEVVISGQKNNGFFPLKIPTGLNVDMTARVFRE